jgi:beta-lactamase regulating signal transducer with metallopeptidase domain
MTGEILSESRLCLLLLTQGTACITLGLAGSYLLRRHASRAHQVLLIALLASVLMPASYIGVKHFGLGVLVAEVPAAPEASLDLQSVDTSALTEIPGVEVESAQVATEVAEPASLPFVSPTEIVSLPWRAILLTCWAAAALILMARLAFRFILGIYLLQNARPVEAVHVRQALDEAGRRIGIAGPVDIRTSNKVCSPVIWCWSRTPTLLVQTDALEDTRPRDWVGVFCHELAHLKRLDHLAGLFAELLICLAPWHLLLWWARKQLLRFSEEACDDWVVAGGQIGVDYAESLLELSPQPELAFVPTVVGKEKTMKARICRIVQDRCGNPRIGRRWASIVTILILGLAVGVAFAQRRPLQHEEPVLHEQKEHQHELMMAGRRNVLGRLLEQLVDQARDIEAALRERGDDPGEDGYVMRAELEALHEHIEIVERQLRNLDRRDRPRAEAGERNAEEEAKRLETRLERLTQVREEAVDSMRHLEMELEALGDRQPETRERLEHQLRQEQARLEMLTREQEQLKQHRVQIESRPEAEHAKKAQEMARLRAREARERAEGEGERMQELIHHVHELQRHARATERDLAHIDDKDSARAHELRASIEATHDEMADAHQVLLSRLRAEAERPARAGATRSVSRRRGASTRTPRQEQTLRQAHEGLLAQIRLTEEKLKAAREEEDRPGAERLQRQLEQELSRLHVAATRAEAERAAQARSVARRSSSQVNPDMERQVEELRGKVDGMHEEMAQMREMLQQLLERREVEEEEVTESPVY